MSEPTLQQEIEAQRPATEGTLQQVAKGIPLMGRDPDGKAKMINVDEKGNVKVQLSGTKVVFRPVDGVAIADTEVRNYEVDVKGISDIMILAYSTLNQPVTITVDDKAGVPLKLWDTNTNTFKYVGSITLPAYADLVLLTSHPEVEFVKRYSGETFTLRIKCDTAPTYGSLTIRVTGVRV